MAGALTALLIAPNRDLADAFHHSVSRTKLFQVMGDQKTYPNVQTLEMRIRQLRPDVVLVDVATNLDQGCELIRHIASLTPSIPVIGLHTDNNSDAILRSLRAGGMEFLYAPFDISVQEASVARIQRLVHAESTDRDNGKVVVFSSTKPGAGASTLAAQTAFALRRSSGKNVLLADFDLLGGSLSFYLKIEHEHSLVDLLRFHDRIDQMIWGEVVANTGGIDVLPAPELPWSEPVDPAHLHQLLQFARRMYDFVIVDLPSVYHRVSLLSISESDRAFLVSTSELSSLHLARRAVRLLAHLGFDAQRYQVLVNRLDSKRDELNISDMGKLFDCAVDAAMPNDYLSLHRAVTLGDSVDADSELGRAIEGLAAKLYKETSGLNRAAKKPVFLPAWTLG